MSNYNPKNELSAFNILSEQHIFGSDPTLINVDCGLSGHLNTCEFHIQSFYIFSFLYSHVTGSRIQLK